MSEKQTFRIITVAVIHRDDKFLLGKRESADETLPDFWSLPAGHIEVIESSHDVLEANLVREVKEEVGVDIEIEQYIDSHVWVEKEYKKMFVVFLCGIKSGEPQAGDETAEVGWFTYDEISKLKLPPNVLRVIDKARKEIG